MNTHTTLNVLDLFCGMKGWSSRFIEQGHNVVTLDFDGRFDPTITADIMTVSADDLYRQFGKFDVILASPPCQSFSVMNIGKNWTKDHEPKTDRARIGWAIVQHTLGIIEELDPKLWIMENPRAKLRRLMEVHYPSIERRTITYCQYGENRQKPTDLWSDRWPDGFVLNPPCKRGAPCHTAAPRGSYTGTQGMSSEESAKVPYLLSKQVCDWMEG